MRWAELVLSYLQTLVWPIVVLCAIALFRAQLRVLLSNITDFSAFGTEAKFAVRLQEQIEVVRTEVEQENSSTLDASGASGLELVDESVVRQLTFVEFSDLSSRDPKSACVEADHRLDGAISRVFAHFAIPADVIGWETAKYQIARETDNDAWTDFFDNVREYKKVLRRTLRYHSLRLSKKLQAQTTANIAFRSITEVIYSLAEGLSINVRRSLANQAKRESHAIDTAESTAKSEPVQRGWDG